MPDRVQWGWLGGRHGIAHCRCRGEGRTCVSSAVQAPYARASARRRLRDAPSSLSTAALFPRGCRPPRAHGPAEMWGADPLVRASVVSAGPHCAIIGPQEGCMRREGTSEAAPEAVRQAVGGGCRSGWGRLLSVENATEAGTWRRGCCVGVGYAPRIAGLPCTCWEGMGGVGEGPEVGKARRAGPAVPQQHRGHLQGPAACGAGVQAGPWVPGPHLLPLPRAQ